MREILRLAVDVDASVGRDVDIGLREIVAYEEKRLAEGASEGVREAVAVVELRGMIPAAETAVGDAGDLGMALREGIVSTSRCFRSRSRFRSPATRRRF